MEFTELKIQKQKQTKKSIEQFKGDKTTRERINNLRDQKKTTHKHGKVKL